LSGDPDYFARALAVLALLLSVAQMVLGSRRGLWQRRSANLGELRQTLEDVRVLLEGASAPHGAVNLWTQRVDAQMVSLRDQVAQVPDRRLQALVQQVRSDLVVIRGTATPSNDDVLNTSLVLSTEQQQILARATANLDAALARVTKCIRKGGLQH
jgi:hypothetical protein